MADLTPKQARFVEEYLIDLNATQAAIRAGYSAATAEQIGYQLLQKTLVSAAVARAKAERSARIGLHADRVLEELAAVGFAKLDDFATWGPGRFSLLDSEEVDARAVQAITLKETTIPTENGDIVKTEQGIKLHDKIGTLKLLGQHLGMFAEKHEHTGKDGAPLTFTISIDRQDNTDASGDGE